MKQIYKRGARFIVWLRPVLVDDNDGILAVQQIGTTWSGLTELHQGKNNF
jgi:hypothetical protein